MDTSLLLLLLDPCRLEIDIDLFEGNLTVFIHSGLLWAAQLQLHLLRVVFLLHNVLQTVFIGAWVFGSFFLPKWTALSFCFELGLAHRCLLVRGLVWVQRPGLASRVNSVGNYALCFNGTAEGSCAMGCGERIMSDPKTFGGVLVAKHTRFDVVQFFLALNYSFILILQLHQEALALALGKRFDFRLLVVVSHFWCLDWDQGRLVDFLWNHILGYLAQVNFIFVWIAGENSAAFFHVLCFCEVTDLVVLEIWLNKLILIQLSSWILSADVILGTALSWIQTLLCWWPKVLHRTVWIQSCTLGALFAGRLLPFLERSSCFVRLQNFVLFLM